jgi:hypothetical protein
LTSRTTSASPSTTKIAPWSASERVGDRPPRQLGELRRDRGRDLVGERLAARDQDGDRQLVVLGLRQQVGGDPARVDALLGRR